jgi:hypothetical protein
VRLEQAAHTLTDQKIVLGHDDTYGHGGASLLDWLMVCVGGCPGRLE